MAAKTYSPGYLIKSILPLVLLLIISLGCAPNGRVQTEVIAVDRAPAETQPVAPPLPPSPATGLDPEKQRPPAARGKGPQHPVAVPLRGGTEKEGRALREEMHFVKPAKVEVTEERVAQLQLPDGFQIQIFAQDLTEPRMMATAPDGSIYVAEREAGRVTLLRDTNGDGKADERTEIITYLCEDLRGVHGLAIQENRLYMVTDREIYVAAIDQNGRVDKPRRFVEEPLPDGGQHPNRTLAFGPDRNLYVSAGSTCNACEESNPESATLLRFSAEGNERLIFAKGLRNMVGFGWHPVSGELWGMDHNTDWRGNDLPPEELNRIEEGNDYGWPYCWGKQNVDWMLGYEPPDNQSRQERCEETEPSVLEYQGHAAPMAMVFYTGEQFPVDYRHDAFVAMRGSWNRNPPYGYKIVRVVFDSEGQPLGFEDFITGWLIENGQAHFGRPTGLAVANDGALLIADDTNGVIYRVSYGEEHF
jgi:glucose/arabinose dehydrogenase